MTVKEGAKVIENPSQYFDDLCEEFLDEVFDLESKLERDEWVKLV